MIKKYFKSPLSLIVIFIGVLLLFYFSGLQEILTLENLKENQQQLNEFVEDNYLVSVVSYLISYILLIIFQIPSATLLTLSGGFLFGLWGVIFVNVAATMGATGSFLLSRYFFRDYTKSKFTKQLNIINKELNDNALSYLFVLRLVPLFPFFIVNLVLGITQISLRKFIWTTSIGTLPGTFVYVYAGTQLSTIDSLDDIVTPRVLLIFVFFGLLSFIPVLIKKLKR
jgi:uncharacterized membrane protein YdjX (TVP38/TMEM64 family)